MAQNEVQFMDAGRVTVTSPRPLGLIVISHFRFRLYSMLVQAAASGLGAAIGRPMLIAGELENRTLVPLFDRQEEAPERCCLITTAASRQRPELRAFRDWVLAEARAAAPPAGSGASGRH